MHLLLRPASLRKFHRQPIEQFGMTWQFALKSKILHRPHQAAAEKSFPMPIHHHSSGEWIFLRHQPPRKTQSILWRIFWELGQERRNRRTHFFFRLQKLSAMMPLGAALKT